ncbi:MAG: TonB-dependent receptor domain-containing protein [Bacteroidales bacterium]
MKNLLFSLLTFFCTLPLLAGNVEGRIIDGKNKQPLDYVNVALYRTQGEKLIAGGVTDAKGAFLFQNISKGSYLLKVTFVGYTSLELPITLTQQKPSINLGSLTMLEEARQIGEVSVVGQRGQMKLDIDKKVFNVEQSIASAGAGASDVLRNIPSVNVDPEGNISLRNNSSVTVWINGRPSGLNEDNRAQILEQMPAETIERIEVITNPSSKYSPEGSAGIINIILKKDRKAGYYGSASVGADTFGGANGSLNINYNSKKWEYYANVGLRSHKFKMKSDSERETEFEDETILLNTKQRTNMSPLGVFFRGGVTYNITDKDHIGLTLMGMYGDSDGKGKYEYSGTRPSTVRDQKSDGSHKMYDIGLNYQKEIGKDHDFSASISFDQMWRNDDSRYSQYPLLSPEAIFYQKQKSDTKRKSIEFQADYSKKFSDLAKIDAGIKGDIGTRNSISSGSQGAHEDLLNPVAAMSNDFKSNEDIYAAYLNYSGKYKLLGYQAGLRGEYTFMDNKSYEYPTLNNPVMDQYKKNYFDLFPTLFLSYSLPKDNELQLSYTRRINRPRGRMLSSYKNISDSTNISYGNPNLQPEFTTALEFNYLKTWDNHTLSTSLYYRKTDDVIQNVSFVENDIKYSTYGNLTNIQAAGVELVGKNRLFKILDLTTTVNLYYNKVDGFSYMNTYYKGVEDFNWDAQMIANFSLPQMIMLQLTGRYNSRVKRPQSIMEDSYSLDIGLRKSFLNRKLNVSLTARDILDSRKRRSTSWGNNFTEHSVSQWGGRVFSFSVSYNFGNAGLSSKKKGNRQQRGDQGEMDMINGDF